MQAILLYGLLAVAPVVAYPGEVKRGSGTIVHQLLLRPPTPSHCRAHVPLRDHLLHPHWAATWLSLGHTSPHRTPLRMRLALVHPVGPISETRHRPRMQRGRPASPGITPAPLFRSFDEARPYGIPLHVATDRQEIRVRLTGNDVKLPWYNMPFPDRVVMLMPPLRMSRREPVHAS